MIMKKTITLLLSLGMLVSTSAISYGKLSEETKNSIYLPSNSWVIAELEKKLASANYDPADDWKEKVAVSYDCVSSGAPSEESMRAVLLNERGAGLVIPLKKEDGWTPEKISAEVKFEKAYAIKDIVAAVSAPTPPVEGGCGMVRLYNGFSTDPDAYKSEMETLEQEQENFPEEEFTFNDETKMYKVSMDGYEYTFGYVFEDERGKKLFWCSEPVNKFKKWKFYNLADVLNAYKEHKERSARIKSPYVHWV